MKRERYPRHNHPISRQQEDKGHYLNAENHHPQRFHPDQHPDQQMQNMEHTIQTNVDVCVINTVFIVV